MTLAHSQEHQLLAADAAVNQSWLLTIHVTDMKRTTQLRVTGDLHIGGLMLRLVDEVGTLMIIIIRLILAKRQVSVAQFPLAHLE